MTNRPGRIVTRVGGTLALSLIVGPMARAADTVKIDSGVLEGTVGTDPSVRVFKGVPFAAPPVGDLRWKAPQPVRAWTGVRKADEWGTHCMQGPMWGPLATRDNLDGRGLPVPQRLDHGQVGEAKQPVLVVFHGGGFAAGSASEPRTDGEWFARQGIVVVEPNYRLGVSASWPIRS